LTANAQTMFDAQEIVISCAIAVLAQLVFVLVFSLPSPKFVQADISNDNARPIAVSITPVLKLGSSAPNKLPSQWQRKRPPPTKAQPAALPSPQAAKTLEAIPKSIVPDASIVPAAVDAAASARPTPPAALETEAKTQTSSTEGSEQGAANGTETDPLKARAVDMYRQQVSAWFMSRFDIRRKLPFATLKTLRATAVVTVTADRKVGSFSITRESGDPIFDAEVHATLSRIQSGGAELPAPPPMYPDILGQSLPVGFQCTIEKLCQ